MQIHDIFKNTAYGDSFFTDTEIKMLEREVFTKTDSKGKQINYIKCVKRQKGIKLTPEEIVRQLYLIRLINSYGYPLDRIQVEYSVNFGREVKRADIVILAKDLITPYIIVELKKFKHNEGKEQLRSYCNATGAPIGVWTNGQKALYYNRIDPNYFNAISDIPKISQKLSDILNERYTFVWLEENDIIKKDKVSLRERVKEIEDEVLANAGVDAFEEIFKMLFAKLYDESICANDPNEYLQFRNSGTADEVSERLEGIFKKAKKKWKGVFSNDSEFALIPSHLAICASYLQDVKLFNNNLDVIDDAFEYLMSKSQKGEKGQYFIWEINCLYNRTLN